MIKLIKGFLGMFDGTPGVTSEPEPFRIRVRPYLEDRSDPFYCIEYKRYGVWHILEKFFAFSPRKKSDLKLDHPVLGSFDEMVEFAKKFKNLEDIDVFLTRQKQKYDSAYQELEAKINRARNKYWENNEKLSER